MQLYQASHFRIKTMKQRHLSDDEPVDIEGPTCVGAWWCTGCRKCQVEAAPATVCPVQSLPHMECQNNETHLDLMGTLSIKFIYEHL